MSTFVQKNLQSWAGLLGLVIVSSGCQRVVELDAMREVDWVIQVTQSAGGDFEAASPLRPADDPFFGPETSGQSQLMLGYQDAQFRALGLDPALLTEAPVVAEDPCQNTLPVPVWARRLSDSGRQNRDVDPVEAPALFANWLPPLCSEGFQCRAGECEATIVELAAGLEHACARWGIGNVYCWGSNLFGQAGQPLPELVPTASEVFRLADAVQIVAGHEHTCALRATGQVVCWGSNEENELGNGTMIGSHIPVEVDGVDNATQITANGAHTCALMAPDDVRCWGSNDWGQLGLSTNQDALDDPNEVIRVPNLQGVREIVAGGLHTCALTETGQVYCWGDNTRGELGSDIETATAAFGLVWTEGVVEVAAGDTFTCARFENGEISCNGEDSDGQLANGVPTMDPALEAGSVDRMYSGKDWICAQVQGRLACWGSSRYGQRLVNLAPSEFSRVERLPGIEGVRTAALGDRFGCFVSGAFQVRCWGWNGSEQLGTGQVDRVTIPTKVGDARYAQVAVASEHSCGLRDNDLVECWGRNFDSRLGVSPRSLVLERTPVQTLFGAQRIEGGQSHACLLDNAGVVKCWGVNSSFQTGAPDTTKQTVQEVNTATLAVDIGVGLLHSCAALVDGRVQCWGDNVVGQLGVDTSGMPRATPQFVLDSQGGVLTDILKVAAGPAETCAIHRTRGVWCWGGFNGPGRAITTSESMPVDIELGDDYGCTRDEEGLVGCWGFSAHGRLGQGDIEDNQLVAWGPTVGLVDATFLAVGSSHACAIRMGGTLVCWGDNAWNQLGDGTREPDLVPTTVPGLTGVQHVAAGLRHTLVVLGDGTLNAFGWNAFGQLGLPPTSSPICPLDEVDNCSDVSTEVLGLDQP